MRIACGRQSSRQGQMVGRNPGQLVRPSFPERKSWDFRPALMTRRLISLHYHTDGLALLNSHRAFANGTHQVLTIVGYGLWIYGGVQKVFGERNMPKCRYDK
jgi:hypothetical protein